MSLFEFIKRLSSLPPAGRSRQSGCRGPLPIEVFRREWFDAAVDAGSEVPEHIDVLAIAHVIKARRYDEQIDVAPLIRVPFRPGSEDDSKMDLDALILQGAQVAANRIHN